MNEQQLDHKLALVQGRECDQYDYLISAFCGFSAGMVDAFFVGAPGASPLGGAMDHAADELVKRAAQCFWQLDPKKGKREKKPETLVQCISYLERAFPVPYDARYAKDLIVPEGVLSGMTPKNHHLLSLAHSPDIIGLIFSIIDQFTNMASFIDQGQVIRAVPAKTKEKFPHFQGSTLPTRLLCGFVNWIGHLISDLVGSSSTRRAGKTGRGMGIPIPFYDLLLLCDFGNFDGESFADLATTLFEQGYDFRHGAAMAIPVMLNDFSVRLLWAIKQKAYHKREWKDCIPTKRHADLRMMLLVSNGALCLVDGADAALRSGGNLIPFLLRLNMIAWFKLILMIFKEIAIRYDFTYEDLKAQFQRVNAELDAALEKLKAIDYRSYQAELESLRQINQCIADPHCEATALYAYLNEMDRTMQFHSFDEFDRKMQDDNFVLEI